MDNVSGMAIETEAELEGLRRAGRVVAVVLRELRRRVQPGVTTGELDRLAGRVFARHGARSAPKLDVTAELDGYYADACVTVPVGPIAPRSARLVRAAAAALDRGLADATHDAPVRTISQAVAADPHPLR